MKVYNAPFNVGTILNTTVTSPAFQLNQAFGYFIQIVIAGTPTGSFELEISGDEASGAYPATSTNPTNWTVLTGSSQAVSAAGNIYWNETDVMYNWVRVVYTDTSGGISTATMSGVFNHKGI